MQDKWRNTGELHVFDYNFDWFVRLSASGVILARAGAITSDGLLARVITLGFKVIFKDLEPAQWSRNLHESW